MSDAYISWLESRNDKLISIISEYKGTTQALMDLCVNDPRVTPDFIAKRLSELDYQIDLQLNEKLYQTVKGND